MPEIRCRPQTAEDEPFVLRVFVSARESIFAALLLPPEQKETMIAMQFRAQRGSYVSAFPDADYSVVTLDGEPVGTMIVDDGPLLHFVDIAILAEYRNRGIGTRIIQDLLDRAAREGKPVELSVEQHNPARRLYQRLGFVDTGHDGLYFKMRWYPPKPTDR